ncbi:MAG: isopenicillin N synthase family oxygenase, partial [Proteobacteria bacterium]|nr:isopenicillin N synthase family oxygenase [Pseudomonadota bacterium]
MAVVRHIPSFNWLDYISGTKSIRQSFIKGVGDALRDLGFFSLSNVNLEQKFLSDYYQEVSRFFAEPTELKKKY